MHGILISSFYKGESRRIPCISTLDALNSVKTGSNKKMQENIPQLFFNFTLETGLTLWKWSTGRQVTVVGKKAFENISHGKF